MNLADHNACTGCGACIAICPQTAIKYYDDHEGFPTPSINEEECIDCGLCNKVCPALHFPKYNPIKKAYAAQILDEDVLQKSTSGGIFTVLAREVIKQNGVVYGCVWDENYNAVVCRAETEEEIQPMRGSKYVWSCAVDSFSEIKHYLDENITVLFTGLPCQCAGLKNYLLKDYENLYLVDFFCGGAPSPLAFKEYLKTLTKEVPISELNLQFRDKEKYGVGVHITYNTGSDKAFESFVKNSYFFSYHTKVFHRMPCYHCSYRYDRRVSDLTFGDYWGIGKFHNEFDIRKGVSALLVNSEKGNKLLDIVRDQLKLSETEVRNIAIGNNLTIGENKTVEYKIPSFRNAFFNTLKEQGWSEAEKKFLFGKERKILFLKNSRLGRRIKKVLKR